MTLFVPANLPSTIVTVEGVAVWSLGILYQLHKFSKYQESEAAPMIPIITAQDGVAADKQEHIIFRSSFTLSNDWREKTTPFYREVQEFSNAPIPVLFLP